MGIINVTPDSFADGGLRFDHARAIDAGWQMLEDGADMLDVGGESTRPGAEPVDAGEELRRVLPVLEAFNGRPLVSMDTVQGCRRAGSHRPRRRDRQRRQRAALRPRPRGCRRRERRRGRADAQPRAVAETILEAVYDDALAAIRDELQHSIAAAVGAGISRDKVIVDPGLGFAKQAQRRVSGARGARSPRGAGPSDPRRAVAQVLSPRRHWRQAGGRPSSGTGRPRRPSPPVRCWERTSSGCTRCAMVQVVRVADTILAARSSQVP